jgi:gamma-glutamylcyclotransferase (GGCT)/AIG2-like uncharacterized protein YtfP
VSTPTDHRLAVYGTLCQGRENHHVLDGLSGGWTRGVVRGRLYPDGWGAARGFPGLVLDETGQAVAVEVLESEDLPSHWARLDAFEGDGYHRVVVTVQTGGGPVKAFLYALSETPDA